MEYTADKHHSTTQHQHSATHTSSSSTHPLTHSLPALTHSLSHTVSLQSASPPPPSERDTIRRRPPRCSHPPLVVSPLLTPALPLLLTLPGLSSALSFHWLAPSFDSIHIRLLLRVSLATAASSVRRPSLPSSTSWSAAAPLQPTRRLDRGSLSLHHRFSLRPLNDSL